MLSVFLNRFAKNQNVIKIYHYKCIQSVPKYSIHKTLKGRWGVAKPEWEYNEFEQPPATGECGLEFVAFPNLHLMVSCLKIDF
jgi:hypothetical protein